jgi:signal peptidase I
MRKYCFIFTGISILFVFAACAPQPVVFEGVSMMPTIKNGDKLLVDRNFGELKRGDIVMFLYPKERTKMYIKRIIGLPGETIEIRDGKTFINGQILDESYVSEEYNSGKMNAPPRLIPEFHYFVMGDNRDGSSDSRYWGTVDKELIKGKYYMTYSEAKK